MLLGRWLAILEFLDHASSVAYWPWPLTVAITVHNKREADIKKNTENGPEILQKLEYIEEALKIHPGFQFNAAAPAS